jgi:hypothetical protein
VSVFRDKYPKKNFLLQCLIFTKLTFIPSFKDIPAQTLWNYFLPWAVCDLLGIICVSDLLGLAEDSASLQGLI